MLGVLGLHLSGKAKRDLVQGKAAGHDAKAKLAQIIHEETIRLGGINKQIHALASEIGLGQSIGAPRPLNPTRF